MNFSSLSGTNRTLDKLPITAEIFNKTLLDDLAVIDVVNLLNNYATGVGPGEAGAGGPAATGTQDGDRFGLSFYTVRGLAVGPLRGDGFLSGNNLGEAFAYDRVEIIRGPQSLLYGANPAGGIINLSTKRANFGRTFISPRWRSIRSTPKGTSSMRTLPVMFGTAGLPCAPHCSTARRIRGVRIYSGRQPGSI